MSNMATHVPNTEDVFFNVEYARRVKATLIADQAMEIVVKGENGIISSRFQLPPKEEVFFNKGASDYIFAPHRAVVQVEKVF